METLAEQIAEWIETVEEAARELDAALLHARPREELKVAVDETGQELDPARKELAAMRELQEGVSAQLDADGRTAASRVVELLTDVDWPSRLDALSTETKRLRELRLSVP